MSVSERLPIIRELRVTALATSGLRAPRVFALGLTDKTSILFMAFCLFSVTLDNPEIVFCVLRDYREVCVF